MSIPASTPSRPRTRSRARALESPIEPRYVPDAALVHNASTAEEPPATLSAEAQDLWRRIVKEASFAFEAHHYTQLSIACAALDRASEAREGVRQAGQLITGRYGSTVNPLVAVERESQRTALRALAALKLDAPVPDWSPRRPGPRGAAQ